MLDWRVHDMVIVQGRLCEVVKIEGTRITLKSLRRDEVFKHFITPADVTIEEDEDAGSSEAYE